jgi:hypothetical protein
VRSKRRNSCSAFFRSPRTVDVAIRQQADALRIAIEEIRRSPLTEYFPKELTGQANGALNILHIGGACIIQYAIGFVIALWPSHGGHYPANRLPSGIRSQPRVSDRGARASPVWRLALLSATARMDAT